MWRFAHFTEQGATRPKPERIRLADLPPGQTPRCCEQPMQPHFAHAQDRYGNEFFVTVWRCLHCGKVGMT